MKKKGRLKKWFDSLIKETMTRGEKLKIVGDKLKDKIIRDIWTLFKTGEEKEEIKKGQNSQRYQDTF